MYYVELNAYISNQTLKSEERKEILKQIDKLIDKFIVLINNATDPEEREALKQNYKFC